MPKVNDCVWAFIACENSDNCRNCDKYLSVNSSMGRSIESAYGNEVELAVQPITKKYRHMMNGDWKILSRDEWKGE